MKYIPISSPRLPGLFFVVDDEWGAVCLAKHWNMGTRYPYFACGPKTNRHHMRAHSFVLPPTSGMVVDHKDGDVFNNTISNLELVTHIVNTQRAHANRPAIRGVRYSKVLGKWCVFARNAAGCKLLSTHSLLSDAMIARASV